MSRPEEEVSGLGEESETETLTLVSKDGTEFQVVKKNALISSLIKNVCDSDPSATQVPIPGVLGEHLELIAAYMAHHAGSEPAPVEKPLRSKHMKDVCTDPWDAEFIDRIGEDRNKLYQVILAANYMDIKSLLHLGCAKVASLIKGQPLEKIKDILSPE